MCAGPMLRGGVLTWGALSHAKSSPWGCPRLCSFAGTSVRNRDVEFFLVLGTDLSGCPAVLLSCRRQESLGFKCLHVDSFSDGPGT